MTKRITAGIWGWKSHAGLSLTNQFVFVNEDCSMDTYRHEWGHCRQSFLLGWLYLPAIGLPSIVWAGLKRLGLFKDIDYYAFYTEKWADRLGGVKR